MNPVEIKIPVWGLLICGLLLVATIVIATLLSVKSHKVDAIQQKYDSLNIKTSIIIKQKTDTIKIYEDLISASHNIISAQETSINAFKNELQTIKSKVDVIPSNEVYDSINAYLEAKTDNLKFDFSGNQIKNIYGEHLQLLIMRQGLIEYDKAIYELGVSLDLKSKQIDEYLQIANLQAEQINLCDSTNTILNSQIAKDKKKIKNWQITTLSGILVGIITGGIIIN